jgi:hypothetical protein
MGKNLIPVNKILTTALKLVQGKRAEQHGNYIDMHERVSALWSAYLDIEVKSHQVAACMMLLKLARDEYGIYNKDDGIDATAYTALWASLTSMKRNRREQ